MKLITRGLMVLVSFLLVACGTLSNSTVGAHNEKVAGLEIAETVKTKELYGAWGATEDEAIEIFYLALFLPNHSGLNYMTMNKKNGKPESEHFEYYTWEFNEKNKIFTMKSFKRKSSEGGGPEKVEVIKEVKDYKTTVYKDGKNILAIRFNRPGESFTFLRLDNETYQKMVKSVPGLPSLK